MDPKGTIIAIGGAEDKGHVTNEAEHLDFKHGSILSHIYRLAGGKKSKIRIITSASSIPLDVGDRYRKPFGKLGCKDFELIHIRSKNGVDSGRAIRLVKDATCVMFSGGDQRKLAKIFRGSKFLEILKDRYQNENIVVAGTSAGAVAMSSRMVKGGSVMYSMLKGAIKLGAGLGFVRNVIFDSHFVIRSRFGRLVEAVALNPTKLGIGLGEDSGVIIRNGSEFQVIGSGMVVIFNGTKLEHNKSKELKNGTPISISNMIMHILANGDRFDIKKRSIEILPVDAEFV